MGCSGLFILGLVLNVAHCLERLGGDEIQITRNVTAVLGEEVFLSCGYVGEREIQSAEWKRLSDSRAKTKRLAGFFNGRPFSRNGYSEPASVTNLTVRMNVSSVEAEGEYICEFVSEDENYFGNVFLTVLARPDIQVQVNSDAVNGTRYQSVLCSAASSRPPPQISWLVEGRAPSGPPFSVSQSASVHSNGTSTLSSILRFPTHLQDGDDVTCVVQHPTLPNPKATTVRVETYTRPNVTIKAEMVQQGGGEFWVVSCVSSGGRPDADISLALNANEELQRETNTDSDVQTSSVALPAAAYEGRNVTCLFEHPKFTQQVARVTTLPSFYLSVRMLKPDPGSSSDESLELQEGQRHIAIDLQVTGNVPHYNVSCVKDDGLLPEGMEVVGSSLKVQGPVGDQHAGLYECFVSYHHLQAAAKLNVTVKPHVTPPVAPKVRVDLQAGVGGRVIECSAADAVPAANVSWLLPEGVSGVSWFNLTSHNGSHSIKGVLLLPACSPRELAAVCVINHPAFEQPENRSVALPLCARPDITVNSLTEWREGEQHTEADCSAVSVAPAATITWHVGNGDSVISGVSETDVQAGGLVSARSSVSFLSSQYSGQNLTCMVDHPSLEAPENRTIPVSVREAHLLSASVERQQDSPLWLAVCDYRGEGVGTDLAWVLPENAKSQTSLQAEHKGRFLKARLTYRFPLNLHEGQNLTCEHHGAAERTTVLVPRFHISVRVLNHTTPLQSRHGGEPLAHRLALQKNQHNQRVLLRVEGNVPQYDLECKRSDGSFVRTDGAAMVLPSALTEQDEGLYTCRASFYHHTAVVNIQLEVTSDDELLFLVSVICISSASAIAIVLAITLWVCCKVDSKTQYKKRESLSALTALMQEPGSPEVKKPPVMESDSKELHQPVSYCIVIDVKSTV